jgi:glucose/arabinose dehydrogenase
VISGLPNGRHNTNGLALGPDGLLYITNGSRSDSGFNAEGGGAEVAPYSGSVLRVDPAATGLVPDPSMVVATGFRNIFDIAFKPGTARAYVPMNGPDGMTYGNITRPAGEDTLNVFDAGDGVVEHFGFPWCLYDRKKGGLAGFTQDASQGSCNPLTPAAFSAIPGPAVQAKPSALFGLHVSSDGLAFNPGTNFPKAYRGDLFVAEFGNFFGNDVVGHKIVRVHFTPSGQVASVTDFMTGVLPLDLTFAPDGSMWVAEYEGLIYRVASVL